MLVYCGSWFIICLVCEYVDDKVSLINLISRRIYMLKIRIPILNQFNTSNRLPGIQWQ